MNRQELNQVKRKASSDLGNPEITEEEEREAIDRYVTAKKELRRLDALSSAGAAEGGKVAWYARVGAFILKPFRRRQALPPPPPEPTTDTTDLPATSDSCAVSSAPAPASMTASERLNELEELRADIEKDPASDSTLFSYEEEIGTALQDGNAHNG